MTIRIKAPTPTDHASVPESRQFLTPVFLGGPGAAVETKRLHKRMDDALSCLGGLQQPGGDEVDRRDAERDLRTIIEDIVTALGGL